MRVIAGIYKGKPLKSPTSDNIRPTGDKVKQAVFTKLQFFVEDKKVLDLFSGSGALGIEALSRGAKEVVFVDKDYRSIKLTKDNLKAVGQNCKVVCADFKDALLCFENGFDLILVDPPYASGVYEEVLNIIYERNLLNKGGIIVCERDKVKEINSNLFQKTDTKVYGTVSVDYYENKNED